MLKRFSSQRSADASCFVRTIGLEEERERESSESVEGLHQSIIIVWWLVVPTVTRSDTVDLMDVPLTYLLLG